MKKVCYVVLALSFIGMLSSCWTPQVMTRHNVTQGQARLIESEFRVITTPVIGELDANSIVKISDSLEFDISMFTDAATQIVPMLEDYKQFTITHCCSQHGYDVVLNPLFQISTNDKGNRLKVLVIGYAAKYNNFRNATNADSWMLPFMEDFNTDQRIQKILKNK